jgi:ferrous iron transport protein A
MNVAAAIPAPVRLAHMPRHQAGTVAAVDWAALAPPEARRLRELGLDEGVEVELIRPSGIMGGPVACRIGRMIVALRRHVARAIHVVPQNP